MTFYELEETIKQMSAVVNASTPVHILDCGEIIEVEKIIHDKENACVFICLEK